MAKIKVSNKNIVEIFERVRKKLEKIKYKGKGGFIFTPHGVVRWDGNKVIGNKKAINWIKCQLKLK